MKKCTICKIDKDLSEYNRNKSRKDGINTVCRDCSKERSKKYYRDNPEKHKANVSLRNTKVREILQDKILEYFLNHPCVECGNTDIRVLEFDHLRDKTWDVSLMVKNLWSWERIKEEIDKCDVVCANCHRIRTCDRTNNYRSRRSQMVEATDF